MLSKPVFAASFAILAALAQATSTPPHTSCTNVGTPPFKGHSRTYTRTGSCTNTLPKTRTTSSPTTVTPTSTSTVTETDTETAATVVDTATDTTVVTTTVSVTGTETDTSTQTTVTTSYATSYFPTTTSGPSKRDLEFAQGAFAEVEARDADTSTTRPPPPNGHVCLIERCVRTRSTSTSTITVVADSTVTTETSTTTSTITPSANTTVTDTITQTSTSSFTNTITNTETSTSTITSTVTATPTFYIQAAGNPKIAAGTDLTNTPDGTDGEGTGQYSGAGTLFALDPSTGYVYDTTTGSPEYLNANPGVTNSPVYFDTALLLLDYSQNNPGYGQAVCSINNQTLALQCNGGGLQKFSTLQTALQLQSGPIGRGQYADTPTVEIVSQSVGSS